MQPISAAAFSNVEATNAETSPTTDKTDFKQTMNSSKPSADSDFVQRIGDAVDGIRNDEKRVDHAMRRMASGEELDSVELLRVQSLVYGYSQRVELASKVVESATSGLKQMLNTQV